MIHCALTIAGSDPTGGAGIQADIKTFAECGVYGLSVLTSLTAQNSKEVRGIFSVPRAFLRTQYESVINDFNVKATKIGMIYRKENIKEISRLIQEYNIKNIVLDPIIESSTGGILLESGGVDILKGLLIPVITLVTPNLNEASILVGERIEDLEAMKSAASLIHDMRAKYVLIKGGHLKGKIYDLFFDGKKMTIRSHERNPYSVRGTGCTLSAAITAGLAKGLPINKAISVAQSYTQRVIHKAIDFKKAYRYPHHNA